jgi:hypothetical protein
LSRDRVLVALEPHAVHAVRPKSNEKRSAAGAWQDVLPQVLAGWARADVTVVASNRLVRYVVVPRTAGVSGDAEELGLARHQFTRVHGERARDWDVRYSRETGLASAVDQGLIETLKQVISQEKRKLGSLQPYLMAAFNRLRARVPKEGAWIVLQEPEATCVALYTKGGWAGVSVSRAAGDEAIARERLRMGGADAPNTVLMPPRSSSLDDGYAMAMSAQ